MSGARIETTRDMDVQTVASAKRSAATRALGRNLERGAVSRGPAREREPESRGRATWSDGQAVAAQLGNRRFAPRACADAQGWLGARSCARSPRLRTQFHAGHGPATRPVGR